MSHFKERTEKICLNCKAEIHGRYCHVCGQENLEPKETVWHLVTHFFNDITHFDGKFFSTVKFLLARPGFLSKEYMIGRRNSYLNPIRMYIFTSAFFFLIFFSVFHVPENKIVNYKINGKTMEDIERMDSTEFANFTRKINREDSMPDIPMTRAGFIHYQDSVREHKGIKIFKNSYKSKAAYDSALASGKADDGWLQRQFVYKAFEVNEKYKGNTDGIFSAFANALLHSLPQIIFISLPLFAWLLKMLYVRRKDFLYVNHAIFSVHFYIFIFIIMLFLFGISKLNSIFNLQIFAWINFFIILGIFFYEYKAMRNFYKQRRAKTIFKFLLLNFFFFIVLGLLFTVFVFFSFFKI